MQEPLIVLTTVPDTLTAYAVARILIEQKLAACVTTLPAVQSIYCWEGKVEEASEVMLLIKTTQARYTQLETVLKTVHPYDVPEIIGIPIVAGWPPYLDWIVQQTMQKETNV